MRKCYTCYQKKDESEFYERKNPKYPSERFQSECKSCLRSRMSKLYKQNKKKYWLREQARRKANPELYKKIKRDYRLRIRTEVVKKYGGKCKCCGEKIFCFLAIDHVNGGGIKHLKSIGGPSNLIFWLKKNNYPEGFQVLCHNCNMAKHLLGGCPHEA